MQYKDNNMKVDNIFSKPICKYCGRLMFPDRELFYLGVYRCHRCNHRGNGKNDYDDYEEGNNDDEGVYDAE